LLRLPLPIALRLLLPAGRDMSRLPTWFGLLVFLALGAGVRVV
jgi:hypothetical protein